VRHALIVLALLAVAAGGCNLGSRTVIAEFVGPAAMNVTGTLAGSTLIGRAEVDLDQVAVYRNTKSGLQSVADVALLGSAKNNGLTIVQPEFWVTADSTAFTNAAVVRSNGVQLWGPITVDPSATVPFDWNKSSALVSARGREVVAREAAGDGRFTIYALGVVTGTSYNFTIQDFRCVLVLDTDS
jgi:hypothetical protein